MAYNFYQSQKSISYNLEGQISSLTENLQQQGLEQLSSRQSLISQLTQERDIEKTEESSQLAQLKAQGVTALVEGGVLGIPAIKNVTELAQKGLESIGKIQTAGADIISNVEKLKTTATEGLSSLKDSLTEGLSGLQSTATEGLETLKATATEGLSGLQSTATGALSTLETTASSIKSTALSTLQSMKSNVREVTFDNPLARMTGESSFESPISMFQSRAMPLMSDADKFIKQQTEALNAYRTSIVSPEQFGDPTINMAGRQLSDIPTPVLPTELMEMKNITSGLETPLLNTISSAKTAINSQGEAIISSVKSTASEAVSTATETASGLASTAVETATGLASTVTSAVEGVAGDVVKKSTGLFGKIFGEAGELFADVLGPIGEIAGAGLAIYSVVKGVEDESAKAQKLPTQEAPAPLPQEQIPTEVQSIAQVGI